MTAPYKESYTIPHADGVDLLAEAKFCTKCQTAKPYSDFHKNKSQRDGFSLWCAECMRGYGRAWWKRRVSPPVDASVSTPSKICGRCGLEKQRSCFQAHRGHKDGLASICKDCKAISAHACYMRNLPKIKARLAADPERLAKMREYRKNDPDAVRRRNAEWKRAHPEYSKEQGKRYGFLRFGVNEAWYERTLEAQGGCAICGAKKSGARGYRFHIDHDHRCSCGKERACDRCRRGLLCSRCNLRLGFLEDEEWVAKAQVYLAKYAADQNPSRITNPVVVAPVMVTAEAVREVTTLAAGPLVETMAGTSVNATGNVYEAVPTAALQ